MTVETVMFALGVLVIASPACLVFVLGGAAQSGRQLREAVVSGWTYGTIVTGLVAAVSVLALMLLYDTRHVPIELGNWVVIPEQHYHFHLKFVFDRLSVPFVILSFLLCGTVGAFTSRYLHRESGYLRFYIEYSIFTLGMIVSSLAGTIEVLFFGWELVGLSSALLVAFFQDRLSPVRNGLLVWTVYRVADAAFLIAAVALHHLTGEGDFSALTGTGIWPAGQASLTSGQALFVGMLLLFAAAGKSALIPFSGWLPRAMEGPTPSSAIFYGALSVHLGAFLLLRISPVLEVSAVLSGVVIVLGLSTSLLAAGCARVQSDIKSALAFASLTQVGLIVAEIGCGLRYLALIHIIGHASLRTLQLLRAPSLLRDYHTLENATGSRLQHEGGGALDFVPEGWRRRLYGLSLERGFLDAVLRQAIVLPFQRVFGWCDSMERRWTDWLSGSHSRESDDVELHSEVIEELRI